MHDTVSDPFGGRQPTSHERMTGVPWDASYHDGPAPWDIEKPQPAIARLAAAGAFEGPVLDAGCGSGENALLIASLGLPVTGVDVAETAIATAREKAKSRGIAAGFVVLDAFALQRLGRTFRTVIDCGLFHTFDAEERTRYVTSLASVMEYGATLYVLCFSDRGPEIGPHPVAGQDLRDAFGAEAWQLTGLDADLIETRFAPEGVSAWLATVKRTGA